MDKSFLLTDFWCYDLSGNKMTKTDIKEANKRNLMVRYGGDEFYLIGSFNGILDYLHNYIGVEVMHEYLVPLKKIL